MLRVAVIHENEAGQLVRFEVQDTGRGIAANVLPRLFHSFEQADAAAALHHGGTGVSTDAGQRGWAAEAVEARQVGRASNLLPGTGCEAAGLQPLAGTNWDSSPPVAADLVLPPKLQDGQRVLRQRHGGDRLLQVEQRQVNALSSGGEMLLPLFQFDFAHGCLRGCVASALVELADVMTDDEVARWFDQPSGWVNGAAPAQVLLSDVRAVIDAARADRFVVKG